MLDEQWRKSSISHTSGCLEARWAKADASGENGCVEVQLSPGLVGAVHVRDSKDPHGPVLTFTATEWTAFLEGVHAGEFTLPPGAAEHEEARS